MKRHQRASHEDIKKIKYQRGIDSDGATFSGCYEEFGQDIGQESGVGSCHFLKFSEVGSNLAGDIQGCRQYANREVTVVGACWLGRGMKQLS